jgi:hypothetical protein
MKFGQKKGQVYGLGVRVGSSTLSKFGEKMPHSVGYVAPKAVNKPKEEVKVLEK